MKFKLEIELGNNAMTTPRQIREAVRTSLSDLWPDIDLVEGDEWGIMDTNGNKVGTWKVVK